MNNRSFLVLVVVVFFVLIISVLPLKSGETQDLMEELAQEIEFLNGVEEKLVEEKIETNEQLDEWIKTQNFSEDQERALVVVWKISSGNPLNTLQERVFELEYRLDKEERIAKLEQQLEEQEKQTLWMIGLFAVAGMGILIPLCYQKYRQA